MQCDGYPKMDCAEEARHHILGYDLCDGCARAFAFGNDDELKARLAVLHEILTDPVNQLEQTKGGYYIYRFDLETMHRIADAIGIAKAESIPVMSCYTPEELGGLIRP